MGSGRRNPPAIDGREHAQAFPSQEPLVRTRLVAGIVAAAIDSTDARSQPGGEGRITIL